MMAYVFFVLSLSLLHLTGAIIVYEVKTVTEGDSVTLKTDVTELQKDDDVLWQYGAENSVIAQIWRERKITPNKELKGRLKLNDQTGSLSIMNIRNTDAGQYEVKISGAKCLSKIFNVSVYARLPVPVISENSSQCSFLRTSSCSVVCSVENTSDVTLSWLKGNSVLSTVSVSDLSISLSLPLEVEDQEKNTYRCKINNTITHQNTLLDFSEICRECEDLALLYIMLITLVVSYIAMAAILCNKCRKCRRSGWKNIS